MRNSLKCPPADRLRVCTSGSAHRRPRGEPDYRGQRRGVGGSNARLGQRAPPRTMHARRGVGIEKRGASRRKLRAYTGIDLAERDLRAVDSTLWFDRAKLRVWDNAHHLVRCTRDVDISQSKPVISNFRAAQLRVWDNAHHLARCTRDVDISQSTHAVSDSRAAQDFVAFRKGCIRFSNSLVSTKPTSLS